MVATTRIKAKAAGPLVHVGNSPVFTERFEPLIDTDPSYQKQVRLKVPDGMVDMFGRPYPKNMHVVVHHFDDYGVIVEGTYDIMLARRALKKAGYSTADSGVWGYRLLMIGGEEPPWPTGGTGLVGGRSGVAFYFDVGESMS